MHFENKEKLLVMTIFSFPFPLIKGGPSDLGTKILQKYQKIILKLPKPCNFHS